MGREWRTGRKARSEEPEPRRGRKTPPKRAPSPTARKAPAKKALRKAATLRKTLTWAVHAERGALLEMRLSNRPVQVGAVCGVGGNIGTFSSIFSCHANISMIFAEVPGDAPGSPVDCFDYQSWGAVADSPGWAPVSVSAEDAAGAVEAIGPPFDVVIEVPSTPEGEFSH